MPLENWSPRRAAGITVFTAIDRALLVMAGNFSLPAGRCDVLAHGADESAPAEAVVFTAVGGMAPGLIVVRLLRDNLRAEEVVAVKMGTGTEIELERAVDIATLFRAGLAAAPPALRKRALQFLVRACAGEDGTFSTEASAVLLTARTALRERLAEGVVMRNLPPGIHLDVLARVDARTCYVRGWIGYEDADLAQVALVSPEGETAVLTPGVFRFARDDVREFYGMPAGTSAEFGFASLCKLETASTELTGWLLEVETRSGHRVEAAFPPALTAPTPVRDALVAELALERPPGQALRVQHIFPAISRLQEQLAHAVSIARVEQFGIAPTEPAITIVVPLYKRIDFVEHQLAQFVHDPELASADLIYVLDSPEQQEALLTGCERLSRLYRVPFRVAVLSVNGGFSTANNLGASLARGRLLLLMNSDVLPDRPGWLGELARFHDERPEAGAVGAKLLYEDDSIQHAGMYFERPLGARLWSNEHYYKGLHRTFKPANENRRVPAVSAACLLIRTALYREMGGLRGIFVQGDFEDSDLCLRLHEAGFENWYAADVALYHLEGQSYPSSQRHANGEFNRWLHTHLWDGRIEALMAAEERSAIHRDVETSSQEVST